MDGWMDGWMADAERPVDGGRPAARDIESQVLSGGAPTGTSTQVVRIRSYSSRGIGTAFLLPRSLRWIRKVARADQQAIAAMIANPRVLLPTTQMT